MHGVSCSQGHSSLTPGYGAQQSRGQLNHMPPSTARELLTRAMAFPSLLELLLCHCSVELLQGRGKRLPFSRTADPGQGLREKAQAPSPCQEITCQVTLPQSCCGAERGLCPPLPVRLHLFHPGVQQSLWEQAALALGGMWLLPAVHTHTQTDIQTHTQKQTYRHTCTSTHLLWTVGCLPIEMPCADAFGSSMKCWR